MKKRFYLLTLFLLLTLILVACGGKKVKILPARILIPENDELAKQVELLVQELATWGQEDEMDHWGYMVTDLDNNGRLEIIFSYFGGSGLFSINYLFEVDEKGETLVFAEWPEEVGQPDILVDSMTGYYLEETDQYYYIVVDDARSGWEVSKALYAVSYRYGNFEQRFLGYRYEDHQDPDKPVIVFLDSEAKEITEKEFNALPDKYFAYALKFETALGWEYYLSPKLKTPDDLRTILRSSFTGFKLEPVKQK